jgi:hypothetical protein
MKKAICKNCHYYFQDECRESYTVKVYSSRRVDYIYAKRDKNDSCEQFKKIVL